MGYWSRKAPVVEVVPEGFQLGPSEYALIAALLSVVIGWMFLAKMTKPVERVEADRLVSNVIENSIDSPSPGQSGAARPPMSPTTPKQYDDMFKSFFRGLSANGKVQPGHPVRAADFVAAIEADTKALGVMSSLMGKPGGQPSTKELQAVFKEIDENGNGELEWAEWSRYVAKQTVALAQGVFKALDPKKGGGTVPVEAYAAALAAHPMMLEILGLKGGTSASFFLDRLRAKADGQASWADVKALLQEVKQAFSRAPSFAKE